MGKPSGPAKSSATTNLVAVILVATIPFVAWLDAGSPDFNGAVPIIIAIAVVVGGMYGIDVRSGLAGKSKDESGG